MAARHAGGGGIGQREPAGIDAQVIEAAGVVPEAELVAARQRLGLVGVEHRARAGVGVLELADQQRAAVGGEAGAGGIGQLRVTAADARGVAVEGTEQHGPVLGELGLQPPAESGERIGRAAAGQVGRGQHGPPEHGVDEQQPVLADHEFLVQALLADPQVIAAVRIELLLVPQLPQAGGAIGLDAAGGLQGLEVFGAEVAAVVLQAGDVQQAAGEAEGALGVELERPGGQAVIGEALALPAGDVAEDLGGLLELQGDTGAAEQWAQASEIAEQRRAARESVERAGRAGQGLRRGAVVVGC